MYRHSAQVQPVKCGQFGKCLARVNQRDAELVLGLAGRDLFVSFRVDIGIDAQAGGCPLAAGPRQNGQLAAFLARFDVELADILVEAQLKLGAGLAHA